jgi:DNA repair protein RadC
MKKMKSIPKDLRPRERLLQSGAEGLTLDELIAVILTTGSRSESVLNISRRIAKVVKQKRNKNYEGESHKITKADLISIGIGPHKASQVLAAQEFGIRCLEKNSVLLTSPEVVFANSQEIVNSDKESLLCFFLNARGELLLKEVMAVGALNKVSVLPREIYSRVRNLPVASIILVHNHPSGNLDPSTDDILFTKRMKKAGEILGVTLLDHLIVTQGGWSRIKM